MRGPGMWGNLCPSGRIFEALTHKPSRRDLKHAISDRSKIWNEMTVRVVGFEVGEGGDWIWIGMTLPWQGRYVGSGSIPGRVGRMPVGYVRQEARGWKFGGGCRHHCRGKHQHARIWPERNCGRKQVEKDVEISFPHSSLESKQ